jgi:hypothetical protein
MSRRDTLPIIPLGRGISFPVDAERAANMQPQERRLGLAIFAIALLVILAATISYFVSSRMGAGINCFAKGCESTLGTTLGVLWVAVAVGATTIWKRYR